MSVFDKVGDLLLALRFKYGVEEFPDSSELAAYIKDSGEADVVAILSPAGRPRPVLVSAHKEGGDVALALVDLDDIRSAAIGGVPLEELEDATSRLGAELFGERGLAPFFFPVMERDGAYYFAMGLKTLVDAAVLTGGLIDDLLDLLEQEGDSFYATLVGRIGEKGVTSR
ncbi:hypothetical protein TUZN_1107 [Thermoproteus uzoniensis 768-20]|uniref:Uncharacterized protein n=1 Tax=Thermoproteus uzoniensis (strain 768-20) TaxID=999630 RepID=F2L0A5_THEU7|nr:hypothetical protein [Thermoproteus uzoniensis]AEA12587.1 hypothetical protein TUZN_1107 [Thermoproteus uzoniensis 768-20]